VIADVGNCGVDQHREQMTLAFQSRGLAEGRFMIPDFAALAIKQSRGDLIEATFLIRAYRTTLPRVGGSNRWDTAADGVLTAVLGTFKGRTGRQVLRPTFDYTHVCWTSNSPRRWRGRRDATTEPNVG